MIKSKLKTFILKRMLILYILLAVLDLLLVKERWFALVGLTAGALYSVVRFSLTQHVFSSLLLKSGKTISVRSTILITIGSLTVVIALLTISIKISFWVFVGVISGILLIPAIIVINGITEALGISCNNFE